MKTGGKPRVMARLQQAEMEPILSEPPGGTNPTNPFACELLASGTLRTNLCFLKPPSMWPFVTAATGNSHTGRGGGGERAGTVFCNRDREARGDLGKSMKEKRN